MNQKQLWEGLAKKNSRYYINSDKGKKITEEQFRESGQLDYEKYVLADPTIDNRDTILEIGCGTGRMTEFMAKDFKKVIGIDISGEMIRQARERLVGLQNVDLHETNGEDLPLEDFSVDICFSYLVFQHFKTREMVKNNFREIWRVLKNKGLFKVRLRTDAINDLEKWWSGVEYDDEEVDQLCYDTGFTLLKVEKVGDYGVWLWLEK